MSMKYKLLLCVVVLLACTATLFAGTTQIYKQTFATGNLDKGATDPLNYGKWTFGGNWAVVSDVTVKLPAGAIPAEPGSGSGGPLLVYQKNGDYEVNIDPAAYVTTLPINCSAATSVQLSFLRSLTVEDAYFDQATVQVSNTGSSWTTIYTNPTAGKAKATDNTSNLTDNSWHLVSYDISAVADKKAAVQIRWGLKSNNNNANGGSTAVAGLRGWAIDDITLTGASGDAFYAPALSGTVTGPGTLGTGFVASGPIWQIGAPAVGTSGQTRDADGDPVTPETVHLGADPGALPSGALGSSILGTLIGANYPAGMSAASADVPADAVKVAPQYLTWGPLDLTGLQSTQLQFQQWLNIGAAPLDNVSIQVHVNNADLDNPDDPEVIKDDKTANTINVTTAKVVYAVSTANHFSQQNGLANDAFKVTFKYDTDSLVVGSEKLTLRYTLDNTASTVVWQPFIGGTITTNTDDSVDDGVVAVTFAGAAFQSKADYILAQDNAKFAVSAILSKTDGTALDSASTAKAVISEAKVVGVLWTTIFVNGTTESLADNGVPAEAAWTLKGINLPAAANGNSDVWVRWVMGKTDSGFNTEYGGWSIADPAIVEASREWAATPAQTIPAGLQWEKTGAATVPAKNTGTAVWDKTFSLYEVKGVKTTGPKPGEPSQTQDTIAVASPPSPIARWNVDSVAVTGTVGADGSFSFKSTLTAPPLSSVVYATPVIPTVAADADLSNLTADWDMANATFAGDEDWLPTYRGTSIANGGIVTSRFPDDAPGTAGNWARFWTEELAGRVPMIVQGYGDGTYRPTNIITRDQIAVYMARAVPLALNPAGELGTVFSDIQNGYWTNGAIEACAAAHIVSGFPDRTYQPTLPITRDAMAKFVTLAAGFTVVPKTATSSDDQKAQVAAGWFPDVPIWDDPATSANERNVFADYINTLVIEKVVTGYAEKNADGDTFFTYRPANKVDRASLAVYVWRAFMLAKSSAVVLGGPAITDVTIATDGAAPAVASYYGYSNAGSGFTDGPFLTVKKYPAVLVGPTAQNYAYVTFDAVRLAAGSSIDQAVGTNHNLDVTFELRRVAGTTGPATGLTFTTSVPQAMLASWTGDVLAGNGEPYRNVVWAIPTGLQGDFNLVVTVEGNELGRQVAYAVRNALYSQNFDGGSVGWDSFGQPVSPGPKAYPTDYISSSFTANTDLFLGAASVELQKTQQIVKRFDTSNRHNIRLGLRYAMDPKAPLGSTESANVEYSLDYGSKGPSATWKSLVNAKGTAVPTKLQTDPVYFSLANGDPNADPVVIGADNNVDFAIRLSITATSAAKVYFDTLTLDAT